MSNAQHLVTLAAIVFAGFIAAFGDRSEGDNAFLVVIIAGLLAAATVVSFFR